MKNRFRYKWDNVKDALWFVAMIEVFIFFLAIVVGRGCGFRNSLIGFAILGAIIGLVLMSCVVITVAIDVVFRLLQHRFWKR